MPTLRLDADAKAGVKAFQDLEKAIDKTEKSLELTTREAKKLETAAGRIAKQNEGPQERYNRKMQELAVLVKQGKLGFDEASNAATRYGQQLERAEQRGKGVFGAGALSSITSLAAGYASVAGAVGLIAQALRQVEQENQRAADSFLQGMGSIGELQQVSATPEEFRANLAYGRSLMRRGIVSDVASAMDISFATDAAGYSASDREFLARVGERKQVAPDKLIGFAQNLGKVRDLYGPGTSLEFAADKLTAGAENIITGGFAETAGAVADFSSSANALGFGGDEAMAALVLAENASKSVNIGGTQVRALLGAIDSKGLNKGTLRDSILGIQSQIDGGASAQSILGSIEAIQAYRQISGNLGRFDQLVGGLGGAQGALASRNFISADPTAAAAAAKQAAEGRLNDKIAASSEKELLLDALVAEMKARDGVGGLGRAIIAADAFVSDVGGTEDFHLQYNVNRYRDQLSPQLVTTIEKYLERIANGVEAGTTRQE